MQHVLRQEQGQLNAVISQHRRHLGRVIHRSYYRLAIPSTSDATVLQYTEFTAYTAILQGASPPVLQGSAIARHRQTWKLHEHYLMGTDPLDSGLEVDLDLPEALSVGDPLRSYFPPGTQIREHRDGVEVEEPGRQDILLYQRAGVNGSQYLEVDQGKAYIQDIVITGEVLRLDCYCELYLTIDHFRAIHHGANST
jgi:hypothetical protein